MANKKDTKKTEKVHSVKAEKVHSVLSQSERNALHIAALIKAEEEAQKEDPPRTTRR